LCPSRGVEVRLLSAAFKSPGNQGFYFANDPDTATGSSTAVGLFGLISCLALRGRGKNLARFDADTSGHARRGPPPGREAVGARALVGAHSPLRRQAAPRRRRPAGAAEPGGSFARTAIDELAEEIGIRVADTILDTRRLYTADPWVTESSRSAHRRLERSRKQSCKRHVSKNSQIAASPIRERQNPAWYPRRRPPRFSIFELPTRLTTAVLFPRRCDSCGGPVFSQLPPPPDRRRE
jgi:8-oxo-dGTP pyrophosphatase MutT (NUDIX family)